MIFSSFIGGIQNHTMEEIMFFTLTRCEVFGTTTTSRQSLMGMVVGAKAAHSTFIPVFLHSTALVDSAI